MPFKILFMGTPGFSVPSLEALHAAGHDLVLVGLLAIEIGCGRRMVDDGIDPASGFRMRKKPGDTVAKGEPLVTVELGPTAKPDEAFFARLASCFEIAPPGTPVSPLPLVVERL